MTGGSRLLVSTIVLSQLSGCVPRAVAPGSVHAEPSVSMIPGLSFVPIVVGTSSTSGCLWVATTELSRSSASALDAAVQSGDPDLPMAGLSLRDAMALANAASTANGYSPLYDLSYWDQFRQVHREGEGGIRLPTAEEWHGFSRYQQPQEDTVCQHENILDQSAVGLQLFGTPVGCSDSHAGLAPVNSGSAGAAGLWAVFGNVSEWTETPAHSSVQGGPRGLPPQAGAVACGGDFQSSWSEISRQPICFFAGTEPRETRGVRFVMTAGPGACGGGAGSP